MDATRILARRLATQRLTGPAAASPVDVVRELLCVQAQEDREARAMVAYRSLPGTVAAVDAALAAGEIIRTHLLRPTWHFVAAEDLRWVLDLTYAKVEAGMASRHRQLGLGPALIDASIDVIATRLAGSSFAARQALGEALAAAGLLDAADPLFGQRLGHLAMLAELRTVICSAPAASGQHQYALISDVVAPTPPRTREEALVELVERFVASHGPVSLKDLQRWTPLTLRELHPALEALGDAVRSTTLDGVELWYGADEPEETRPRRAWLLSTFDEAYLTYRPPGFRRTPGHPSAGQADWFIANRGGAVILDLQEVGSWQRRLAKREPVITVSLDPALTARQRAAVDDAVDHLQAAFGS